MPILCGSDKTAETMVKPLSPENAAAIRASATCLCWKRAADLPPQLRVVQGKFSSTVELAYSAVFPPAETPLRGVALFLHGINEHSERYFHVFEALCAMGFGVVAYDLRSHGKSHKDVPNMIGHVERFQEFVDDTNAFLAFAKREIYPQMGVATSTPLVAMAMSLGTLITVHTVLSQQHEVAALVLVGPAVSVEMTATLKAMSFVSSALSTLLPKARLVPAVNEQWICRDPLRLLDYDADPLATREPVTCRMGAETLGFMTSLQDNKTVEDPESAFCKAPLLMIMGSEDKVTSLPIAQKFYERVATKDKKFELIQGAYHVLFEDFERARVLSTIEWWLQERFPLPQ